MNRCSLSFHTCKWRQSQCSWLVSSTAQFHIHYHLELNNVTTTFSLSPIGHTVKYLVVLKTWWTGCSSRSKLSIILSANSGLFLKLWQNERVFSNIMNTILFLAHDVPLNEGLDLLWLFSLLLYKRNQSFVLAEDFSQSVEQFLWCHETDVSNDLS